MDAKDILQANVTVIAGTFIFLSISLSSPEERKEFDPESTGTIFGIDSSSFVAFLILVPFAMSSLVVVAAQLDKSKPVVYERAIKGAIWLMIWGFFMLILMSMLVFMGVIRLLDVL
jgi:hypothetical protein